ncbi:MAG: ABC transporter permease, partial [Promethearchaeota archaeon]
MVNSFLFSYAFKDLFRQKTRTYLGIFGVAISLFLLTAVSFATDSISANYISFVTEDSGNQDMILTTRPYANQPENQTAYFDYQELTQQIQANFSEIAHFLPRADFWSSINTDSQNDQDSKTYFQIVAMNFSLEEEIHFGQFKDLTSGINLEQGLPVNSCIVSNEFAQDLNLSTGEIIEVKVFPLDAKINLTITSMFTQSMKFPKDDERDVVVDIGWWGQTANAIRGNNSLPVDTWVNKTDKLVLLLANEGMIYDTRDVDGSIKHVSDLGGQILVYLNINAWDLDYPKLTLLFYSKYLSMTMQILFMMITIVAMLISGILINGILSTNVEERIREYGINRVLGARKNYNLYLILLQSSILCGIGTLIGILSAYFFDRYALMAIAENQLVKNGFNIQMLFVAKPLSFVLSFAIGIGVSLFVSVTPALKVRRMKIVHAINPYRSSDEVYKMVKEGGANKKLIIIGIVFAANAGFIYFIIPRVLLSLEIALLVNIMIGTLLLFLIGVSLMAIGLMPLLIRLLVKIFTPFHKKIMNIVKITVHRHERRNLSTVVMFVLAFSFIMFTTSMISIQSAQVGALIEYRYGSDIVITPRSYNLNSPTTDIIEDIMHIQGIERVSTLLADDNDLEEIHAEENIQYSVNLGDYINFKYSKITLYGIDQNYKDTIMDNMQPYIRFTEGNPETAFKAVFNNSKAEIPNIIISTHVANDLQIHLNDNVRLTFNRGTEEKIMVVHIVGVAKNMPGLRRFMEGALGGGMMTD